MYFFIVVMMLLFRSGRAGEPKAADRKPQDAPNGEDACSAA